MLSQFPLNIPIVVLKEKVLNHNFFYFILFIVFKKISFRYFTFTNVLSYLIVKAELPLEFPDGTTPVACRVSIYDTTTDSKVGVGSLMDKALAPPLPSGSIYMEEVHAKVCLLIAHLQNHLLKYMFCIFSFQIMSFCNCHFNI